MIINPFQEFKFPETNIESFILDTYFCRNVFNFAYTFISRNERLFKEKKLNYDV